MKNTQVLLKERPQGMVKDTDFEIRDSELAPISDGSVLVKVNYISLDPAMRGWMNPGTTYIAGVELNSVMRAFAIGEVIESKHAGFSEGDVVSGLLGAQTYSVMSGDRIEKVNAQSDMQSKHLGILGMPGMTAYFGLLEKGRPESGNVVLVSGAAGIVGSTVGQIAKIKGCRVVGTAGSDEKCDFLVNECGFDVAINYKTSDVNEELSKHCPNGIDIYYDNVGGPMLDTALLHLARGARVVICGAISQYNKSEMYGPKNYMKIVSARGYINGIIVFDYMNEYGRAVDEISTWIKEGKIAVKEHIIEGIDQFPNTLRMLFEGKNFGKLLIKV